MNETHAFGSDQQGRPLLLHAFSDWKALPDTLPDSKMPFLCILAADASDQSAEVIGTLMLELLIRGCRYIVCWGPDCERVHDIFDEKRVMLTPCETDHWAGAHSTWHGGESLRETLWFAMFVAAGSDTGIRSILALCEEPNGWAAEVAQAFANPGEFDAQVRVEEQDEP